jgi:hypothetical protein
MIRVAKPISVRTTQQSLHEGPLPTELPPCTNALARRNRSLLPMKDTPTPKASSMLRQPAPSWPEHIRPGLVPPLCGRPC